MPASVPTTKAEAKIRDEIIDYLRERGISATKEKRLTDPDDRHAYAQADIFFTYRGIYWFVEVKRSAIEKRTLSPVQEALGQSLHYLYLASFNDIRGRVRAAIVVAGGWPGDTFIETCESRGVEVWGWRNHHLTRLPSDYRYLPVTPVGALRTRHPLSAHVSRKAA